MESQLLILVTYHAKPGGARAFLQQIAEKGLREQILAESGCLRYDYYLASDDPDTVLLVELWQTAAQQVAHMQQPHMQQLLAIKNQHILRADIQKYSV